MDEELFSRIVQNSRERMAEAAAYRHRRYLYNTIRDAPKEYFIGVHGLRGVGKTAMLLQLANETSDSLYFSADAAYLANENLYEVMRFCAKRGYRALFIDEIHLKEEWRESLKTAHDEKLARVFFSGSSALEIREGADLSRRALIYQLLPLSFREYLMIKKGARDIRAAAPEELFDPKKRAALAAKLGKYSIFLQEYFRLGGVAYPSDDEAYFYKSLESALDKIVHSDLRSVRSMRSGTEGEVRKILNFISISPVGGVNYSSLASKVSVSKPTVIGIMGDLERIGLAKMVLPCGKALVRKEPKIFLAAPYRAFIAKVLGMPPDAGAQREEFFAFHAGQVCHAKGGRGESTPDFEFSGKLVEVGGPGKKAYQNPDFIVAEGEAFTGKYIPLYLAGFLY